MEMNEKRIITGENRELIFRTPPGTFTFTEIFTNKDEVVTDYSFMRTDDYLFNAFSNDDYDKYNSISFRIDKNHPLYMPLFHLLNYDEELIIDDDDTRELLKKYMTVYRSYNDIFIEFNNFITYDLLPSSYEKFNIFIKNIDPQDGRSKIEHQHKDTKIRLTHYFKELYERIYNGLDELTIEEYLIKNMFDINSLKSMFKIDYEYESSLQRERRKYDLE